VAKGEELCIDYNHRDAITMLTSYGCTLGLEKMVTVSRLKWMVPPHFHKIFDLAYLEQGTRLRTEHACGLDEEELMQLRMSSFWSTGEYLEALAGGYFEEGGSTQKPPDADEAKWRKWRATEATKLSEIAGMCEQIAAKWDARVGGPVATLRLQPQLSWVSQALCSQHETDLGLFTALGSKLRGMQQALAGDGTGGGSGESGGPDESTAGPSESILFELS